MSVSDIAAGPSDPYAYSDDAKTAFSTPVAPAASKSLAVATTLTDNLRSPVTPGVLCFGGEVHEQVRASHASRSSAGGHRLERSVDSLEVDLEPTPVTRPFVVQPSDGPSLPARRSTR